jgi:hypothetical protein
VAAGEVNAEPLRGGLALDHEHGRSLRVQHGTVELLRYVYGTWDPQYESPRPYFHPVRTLDGDVVTAYRPHDHVWHKGISLSLPVVGDGNFWGGGSYVHGEGYLDLPNNGSIRHRAFTEIEATPDRIAIAHDLDWITEPGELRITERRAVTVTLADGAWILTFATALTNASGETVRLGSPTTKGRPEAGYGGLFWRGPRSFTGGIVHAPGGPGGDELMGSRQPWLGFTGQHDGHGRYSTLVIADSPANPGHPVEWFVRTSQFPGACPAPFFTSEVPVEPGETLRLEYAIAIAGGRPDPAGLAAAALKALS